MAPLDWWGGPEWPAKANRFVDLLDMPNDPHGSKIQPLLTTNLRSPELPSDRIIQPTPST